MFARGSTGVTVKVSKFRDSEALLSQCFLNGSVAVGLVASMNRSIAFVKCYVVMVMRKRLVCLIDCEVHHSQ